jgi:hypothetical protein
MMQGRVTIGRRSFVSILALSVAMVAFGCAALGASAAERRAGGSASQISLPFQRGVTLGDWGSVAYEPRATKRKLKRLKRKYHVRWVTFFVVWIMDTGTSNTIHPGRATASQRNLVAAMRSARKLGIKVILRPYIDRRDPGWRGNIKPSDPAAWFASYRQFILRYARFAQRKKAKGYVIGSELESMSSYTTEWQSLISAVRRRFKGFVTYQANWGEFSKVAFWPSLDIIDISAYFPLTTSPAYTVDDLVAGWGADTNTRWFGKINAFRSQLGLPVMFGEIGYRSVQGSAMRPWDTSIRGPYSPEAQRIAYLAALRVWYRVPWFRGFHWWYTPTTGAFSQVRRTSHVPAPPARLLVRRWYRKQR